MSKTAIDLLILLAAGACGGALYGLVHGEQYLLRVPLRGKKIDVGFLGDLLAGCCGSVGIFVVAGNLIKIKWDHVPGVTDETLKVLALGIVAGFSGLALMHRLSDSVLSQVSKVADDVETLKRVDEARRMAAEGNRYLFSNQYVLALESFDKSLEMEPDAIDVLMNRAMALKRLGRPSDAIEVINRVLELDPANHRAFYNRACYGCLVDPDSRPSIVSDLRRAIELKPVYKTIAISDADFSSIRDSTDFRLVVGSGDGEDRDMANGS